MSEVRKIIKLSGVFNSTSELTMRDWSLTGFMLIDSSGLIVGYIKNDSDEHQIIGLIGNEFPRHYRVNIIQDEDPVWSVSKDAAISFEMPKKCLKTSELSLFEARNTAGDHPATIGHFFISATDVSYYSDLSKLTQDYFSTFDPQFACNHGAIKATLGNYHLRHPEDNLKNTVLWAGHNDGYYAIYETIVDHRRMLLQNA